MRTVTQLQDNPKNLIEINSLKDRQLRCKINPVQCHGTKTRGWQPRGRASPSPIKPPLTTPFWVFIYSAGTSTLCTSPSASPELTFFPVLAIVRSTFS